MFPCGQGLEEGPKLLCWAHSAFKEMEAAAATKNSSCRYCHSDLVAISNHAVVCGSGPDRILRHNSLRDIVHEMASLAGVNPEKEPPSMFHNSKERPADVFLPGFDEGKDVGWMCHDSSNLLGEQESAICFTGPAFGSASPWNMANLGKILLAFIPLDNSHHVSLLHLWIICGQSVLHQSHLHPWSCHHQCTTYAGQKKGFTLDPPASLWSTRQNRIGASGQPPSFECTKHHCRR